MSRPPEPAGRPYGRGAFLLLVAGGLSSLAWASPALRLLDSLLPGGAKALLPSQGWRIYTIGDSMPRFDRRSWRLRIEGLVAKPRELRYEELLRLPRAEQTSDFHCVTGWTVRDVRWAGLRFHDLLALAEPLPQAHALRFVSAERPYEDTLTLAQALRPDTMLAYEMDGQPLSRPHGAPVRVVMPAMYGSSGSSSSRTRATGSGRSSATTETPGSATPRAMPPERTIRRFSGAERALHWVHASAFFVLLASGLVLYVPPLSELVARRQLVKDVHLYTGLAWAVLMALLILLGVRHGLRETIRELERFDAEDLRWLLRRGGRAGRFNAGQKLNAIVTAAFAVLFGISGFLLWYGERETRFRLANTILLHDGLMYAALVLLAGHLYLSLIHPSTRHALRGIVRGTVEIEWARRHHPRWAALADDADVGAEGGDREPERLVETNETPVFSYLGPSHVRASRDPARVQ